MEQVRLGKYRHYKGVMVKVIGIAKNSESLEDLVVYEKLEDFGGFKKGSIWVRPLDMFTETVTVDGKKIPRFEFIEG